MRYLITLLAILSLTTSVLLTTPSQAVTYPDALVQPGVADSTVALYKNVEPGRWITGGPFCTGSLIAPRVVVTAAHCVFDLDHENVLVTPPGVDLGARDFAFETVMAIISHERYLDYKTDRNPGVNDIALLYLNREIGGRPIALPSKKQTTVMERGNLRIYGYGEDQNGNTATTLRMANLRNQSKAAKKAFTNFNPTTQVAAGKYNKRDRVYSGACFGDSGGPLIGQIGTKQYLVGIASYVGVTLGEVCDSSLPSVFMRTSFYMPWVQSALPRLVTEANRSTFDIKLTDPRGDMSGSRGGADIIDLSATVSKDGLEINFRFLPRYSNSDFSAWLYLDINNDGVMDLTTNDSNTALVDSAGSVYCSVSASLGLNYIVYWSIPKDCIQSSTWIQVELSLVESLPSRSQSFYAKDTIYLDRIPIPNYPGN